MGLSTHACRSLTDSSGGKLMRSHLTVSLPWNPPSWKVFARLFCGITSEGLVPSSQSGPSLPQIAAIIHRSKEASRISDCGVNYVVISRSVLPLPSTPQPSDALSDVHFRTCHGRTRRLGTRVSWGERQGHRRRSAQREREILLDTPRRAL